MGYIFVQGYEIWHSRVSWRSWRSYQRSPISITAPHSIGPQLIWSPIQMVPPFNRSPNSGQIVRAYRRPMDAIFMFIWLKFWNIMSSVQCGFAILLLIIRFYYVLLFDFYYPPLTASLIKYHKLSHFIHRSQLNAERKSSRCPRLVCFVFSPPS